MAVQDLTDRIVDLIRKILKEPSSPVTHITYGTYQSANTLDSNLSVVTIGAGPYSSTSNSIRKLSHVTGLTAGNTVMMVSDANTPLTIIGVVVGNITLA